MSAAGAPARRVAIVTGGSRGIGRAIAERLAADGAAVLLTYAGRREAAEEVVAGIEARGGEAAAEQAVLAERGTAARLFDAAEARWGGVDVLVNNVGVSVFGPHAQIADEDLDRVLAVNVRGTFEALREAARRLRDGGRIVSLSTGGTRMPMAGAGVYAASKATIEQMSAALAHELGPRGITVNCVLPGATQTEGLVLPAEQLDALVAQTPLGRLGEPEDVARAVALLVSDDAAWVTGQTLAAAGGVV